MATYTPTATEIVHYTKADFRRRPIVEAVHIVQYDDSMPILAVELYSDGLVYQAPSANTFKIRFGHGDRTFSYVDALGTNADRTIVYFRITPAMTYRFGLKKPVVEMTAGFTFANSSEIPVMIDRNPIQESDEESYSEYSGIRGMLDAKVDKSAQATKSSSMTQEVGIDENGKLWSVPGSGGGASGSSRYYGTCLTAAGTTAKTVTVDSAFTLIAGVMVTVKFTNTNSASSPTLNVNSTGAKSLMQYGTTAVSTAAATSGWQAGAVVSFTYDGTNWVRDQGYNTNTTYSAATTSANGLMSSTDKSKLDGLNGSNYILKDIQASKTDAMTQAVGLGTDGKLYTTPGGGSGTSDYDDLTNRPQINSVTLTGNKSFSDLGLDEVEVPLYTVTTAESATATLKNYDTTVLPGSPTTVALTLPTPAAGNDYLTSVIFKAGASGDSMLFNVTRPTEDYALVWATEPTWTSGKIYEIIFRCLWLTNGSGDIVISAEWSEN